MAEFRKIVRRGFIRAMTVILILVFLSSFRLAAEMNVSVPAKPFVPDEHTLGLWHFDGGDKSTVFLDSSKYKRDGYFLIKRGMSLKYPRRVKGKFGRAVEFKFGGELGSVVINDTSGLAGMNQITVEAWVYIYDMGMPVGSKHETYSYSPFVAKAGSYLLRIGGDANSVNFVLWTNGPKGHNRVNMGLPITPGVWHHIAGMYDGSRVYLIVDGRMRIWPREITGNISSYPKYPDLRIGFDRRRYPDAIIDEVRISDTVRYLAKKQKQ